MGGLYGLQPSPLPLGRGLKPYLMRGKQAEMESI